MGCVDLLFDSRTAGKGVTVAPDVDGGASRLSGAWSLTGSSGGGGDVTTTTTADNTLSEVDGVSTGRAAPAPPTAAATWNLGGVRVHGDFRITLHHTSRKKPLCAMWLHSAALPVLPALHSRLVSTLVGLKRGAVERASLQRSVEGLSDGSLSPRAAGLLGRGLQEEEGTPAPTLELELAPLRPGSGVGPLTMKSATGNTEPSFGRGSGGSTPRAGESDRLAYAVVKGDVPGCPLGTHIPLLGALYTAGLAGSRSVLTPGRVSSAPPSLASGSVSFGKSDVDFAAKDRKHRVWPAGLRLTLRFNALDLPVEFWDAVSVS